MKKFLLILTLLTAGTLYLVTGFKNREISNLKDTKFDYNFAIKDLDGTTLSFDQYKGKVVFLNLWATWCGPCRYEMPGIQKLYEKAGSDDIVFVMLSIDKPGDLQKVDTYVTRNKYTFPVYMPSGRLTNQLNVPSIPTTFIIDKSGNVAVHHVGSTNYDTEKYRKLLTELSAK
jgi:thiol-disulfide isomerase/thioredoxin